MLRARAPGSTNWWPALQREALASDHDPFDDAMVAAVVGLAEAMKAETDALADAEARLGRLARKGAR